MILQFIKANFLIIILIIGVLVLLLVLFRGKKSNDQDLVKQLIAAKDSVIKKENEKTAIYERLIEEKERTNEVLLQRDSVLIAHYNETEKLYKQINDKVKSIPARINRIANNNDSLRRLLAEHYSVD